MDEGSDLSLWSEDSYRSIASRGWFGGGVIVASVLANR